MSKTLSLIALPNSRKVLFASLPLPRVNGSPTAQVVGPDCLAAHLGNIQVCSEPRDATLKFTSQAVELAAAKQAGAHYIDINPWLCSAKVCNGLIGQMNVYVHNGHISATYATYVSGALQNELQPIMDAP